MINGFKINIAMIKNYKINYIFSWFNSFWHSLYDKSLTSDYTLNTCDQIYRYCSMLKEWIVNTIRVKELSQMNYELRHLQYLHTVQRLSVLIAVQCLQIFIKKGLFTTYYYCAFKNVEYTIWKYCRKKYNIYSGFFVFWSNE